VHAWCVPAPRACTMSFCITCVSSNAGTVQGGAGICSCIFQLSTFSLQLSGARYSCQYHGSPAVVVGTGQLCAGEHTEPTLTMTARYHL